MKLITKFWLLFLVAIGLGIAVNVVTYSLLNDAHEKQLIKETQAKLSGLADQNVDHYTQELVNEMFFAVKLRSEELVKRNLIEGIKIGLYRKSGEEIYGSKLIQEAHDKESQIDLSKPFKGFLIVKRDIKYGNDLIGTLWFAKPVRKSSDHFLKKALLFTLGIQITIFLLVVLVGQQTMSRLVLKPLTELVASIPQIARYLDGRDKKLDLPTNLGSHELNNLSNSMRVMTAKVSEAMKEKQRAVVESEKQAAVAQMTQMLAHDVRKPFTLLKMAVEAIDSVKDDPKKIVALADELGHEANKAMISVNGLISDVMEVGNTSKPELRSQSVSAMINTALISVFRYQEACGIQLRYDLQHRQLIDIDKTKFQRVLVNIIDNARQVISANGKIGFRTCEIVSSGKNMTEFVIENDGPAISSEIMDRIFEVFVTKGKTNGTGLGLAICKRVIESHGGAIGCRNTKAGVEFWFTVPTGTQMDTNLDSQLPATSGLICASALRVQKKSVDDQYSESFQKKRRKVIDLLNQKDKLNILVFDDDLFYARALTEHVLGDKILNNLVSVTIEETSQRVLTPCPEEKFSLIICDVDMGPESLNGYEIVRRLRKCGSKAHICIHSNRSLPDDYRRAVESGADAFMPKPMTRIHLMDLLLKSITGAARVKPVQGATKEEHEKPLFVLIEDQVYMRHAWQRKLEASSRVLSFRSPEEFERAMHEDKDLLEKVSCVITDFYISPEDDVGETQDSSEFAKAFVQIPHRPPLLLASNGEFNPEDIEMFDARIPKGADIDEILQHRAKNPI
jgi:signal transduction histidine kinase/CheY-like chemotaxis protein